MLRSLSQRTITRNALFGLSCFSILLLRGRDALDRIPADQGYGIFESARSSPSLDSFTVPYLNLVSQSVPYLVSRFPISFHAVVGALVVHACWTLCALVISHSFCEVTRSRLIAYLAGLCLVLVPHASESALGNPGLIGFALVTSMFVVTSIPTVIERRLRLPLAMAILSGFTSPLGFLAIVPILYRLVKYRRVGKNELVVAGILFSSLIANLTTVGISQSAEGRDGTVMRPWGGMGLFWWSGLIGPLIGSLALLLFILVSRRLLQSQADAAVTLSLGSLATSCLAYLLGGIADRYFIAPVTLICLATIALGLAVPTTVWTQSLPRIVLGILMACWLIAVAKWFPASWYLTSGPTWSSEVRRARAECSNTSKSQVELAISPVGTHALSCQYLLP